MLSTEGFFEVAQRAGMLKAVSWTPSAGGAAQTADAFFRAPAEDVLAGSAFTPEYSISYPATKLTGLLRGETVTVDGASYKVREDPRTELDGSRLRALLSKV